MDDLVHQSKPATDSPHKRIKIGHETNNPIQEFKVYTEHEADILDEMIYNAVNIDAIEQIFINANSRFGHSLKRTAKFLKILWDAGYTEKSIAIYQGLLEFNFFTKGPLNERKDVFKMFWESNCQRIGEVGAMHVAGPRLHQPVHKNMPNGFLESQKTSGFTYWAPEKSSDLLLDTSRSVSYEEIIPHITHYSNFEEVFESFVQLFYEGSVLEPKTTTTSIFEIASTSFDMFDQYMISKMNSSYENASSFLITLLNQCRERLGEMADMMILSLGACSNPDNLKLDAVKYFEVERSARVHLRYANMLRYYLNSNESDVYFRELIKEHPNYYGIVSNVALGYMGTDLDLAVFHLVQCIGCVYTRKECEEDDVYFSVINEYRLRIDILKDIRKDGWCEANENYFFCVACLINFIHLARSFEAAIDELKLFIQLESKGSLMQEYFVDFLLETLELQIKYKSVARARSRTLITEALSKFENNMEFWDLCVMNETKKGLIQLLKKKRDSPSSSGRYARAFIRWNIDYEFPDIELNDPTYKPVIINCRKLKSVFEMMLRGAMQYNANIWIKYVQLYPNTDMGTKKAIFKQACKNCWWNKGVYMLAFDADFRVAFSDSEAYDLKNLMYDKGMRVYGYKDDFTDEEI